MNTTGWYGPGYREVTPTVGVMTSPLPYQRLPYADADTTATMRVDCDAAALQMSVLRPAPSIRFEDNDREVRKHEIRVSDAARRLAAALHLHLD